MYKRCEDRWLKDIIANMMKIFIPKITNASSHIIKPKWFTIEVLMSVKLKHRCFCEYKHHCNDATLIIYVDI